MNLQLSYLLILAGARGYIMKIQIIKLTSMVLCILLTIGLFTVSQDSALAEESTIAGSNNFGNELHAFYDSRAEYSPQMEKYIESLDFISFAWSRIYATEPGSLNTVKGQNGNNGFYYPENYREPLRYAKSKGKSIQISIYMSGSDSALLLPYADKRSVIVQTVAAFLQKEAVEGEGIYYDGVVIDFEGLRDTDGSGNPLLYEGKPVSYYFVQFLTELKAQLDTISKKLYVAVNPSLYYNGFDYKSILAIAERVILMAHDYEPFARLRKDQVMQYTGYDSLKPVDSLAPIRRVKQALDSIKSKAGNPADISKVWLQICFDSAQWKYEVSGPGGWNILEDSTLNKEGMLTPLYKYIKARVDNTDGVGANISYGYNNELQSPFIQYFNTQDKTWNIVLYEDSNSIGAKIDLAKAYGLGGISLWSLGNMPDYNDSVGKSYHLDGWDTVLLKVRSPYTVPPDANILVKFTDKLVEKAVRDRLGKPDGNITAYDVKGIYRLELPAGVKSLSDLKNLTNLEYLDLQNLKLANIAPLGSLTNLRVLYLQRNVISDISPLKKLTRLQILSLNGNRITDIRPLAGLKQLQKLYIRENRLTSITALSGLVNLTSLQLGMNNISDVGALAGMKNLQILSLDVNKLAGVKGLSGMYNLKSLNLSSNKITDIQALKGLKNLQKLDLRNNMVSSVVSLKGLSGLQELRLSGNRIKDYGTLKQLYTKLTVRDFKI